MAVAVLDRSIRKTTVTLGGMTACGVGELDEWAIPSTARFQCQEWFQPWIDAQISAADEQTLLAYAQYFWFGH